MGTTAGRQRESDQQGGLSRGERQRAHPALAQQPQWREERERERERERGAFPEELRVRKCSCNIGHQAGIQKMKEHRTPPQEGRCPSLCSSFQTQTPEEARKGSNMCGHKG